VALAWTTDHLEFEAIRDLPPLPKVVISVPNSGVIKLPSLINMAPNMGDWQHAYIEILFVASATKHQCAQQADCCMRSIQ